MSGQVKPSIARTKMVLGSAAGAMVGTLIFAAFFGTPFATLLGTAVGALGGLVAVLVGAWLRRHWPCPIPELLALGLAALVLSPLWLGSCVSVYQIGIQSPVNRRQAREDGNRIVEAIQEYERHEGHYPGSLTDLVPRYLDYLPTLPNGEPFRYNAGEEGFSLLFNVGWLSCHYDNRLMIITCQN